MSPLKSESPLYGVLALPEEDDGFDTLMERRIKIYTELKIREVYGLSIDEFYARSRREVKALIQGAEEYLRKKHDELEEQAKTLEELTNPLGDL